MGQGDRTSEIWNRLKIVSGVSQEYKNKKMRSVPKVQKLEQKGVSQKFKSTKKRKRREKWKI